MAKLHLLIADNDVDYVNSVVLFLTIMYTDRFIVSSFTQEQPFLDYCEKNTLPGECGPDILLLGDGFNGSHYQAITKGVVIRLENQDNKIKYQKSDKNIGILKYQRGDSLISQALQIFSDISSEEYSLSIGNHKTRIIAFCSPDGGAGKTTAAIGLSIQAAWEGKKVFYLNLECMPSTELFFTGEQDQNLSNVFYYLKNTKKNLSVKLDGAKCIDPWYQIHYFKGPDSALDLKEDITHEIKTLLSELVVTGRYDRIYIDMSSSLDKNYLAVLEACDDILVVYTQDVISVEKTKRLIREIELQERGQDLLLLEKVSLVLNKYGKCGNLGFDSEEMMICGKYTVMKIPWVTGLMIPQAAKYRLDMNSTFGTAIHELAARF